MSGRARVGTWATSEGSLSFRRLTLALPKAADGTKEIVDSARTGPGYVRITTTRAGSHDTVRRPVPTVRAREAGRAAARHGEGPGPGAARAGRRERPAQDPGECRPDEGAGPAGFAERGRPGRGDPELLEQARPAGPDPYRHAQGPARREG